MKSKILFYLVFLFAVVTFSSCNKMEDEVVPQNQPTRIYTAEEAMTILSREDHWPTPEEIFSFLKSDTITAGEKPWEKKETTKIPDEELKNSGSTIDIAFSYGEVFVSFSGDTVKQVIYWSVIENGGGQNYLLEKGTVVKHFDLSINLLYTEFYIGWESNDPYCVEVSIQTNLQAYQYDYLSLNFNYPITWGTLNFQRYMEITNGMKMYLPKIDFILSAEFNSVGKIIEFNPRYQNQINIDFEIQENAVAVIDFFLANYGIGKNTQIIFNITEKGNCEVKKEISINIGENLPYSIQFPLSFEPEEVGFFTKIFHNGIVEYGEYQQKKAVVMNPNGTIPLMYQLGGIVNIAPFYSFYEYTQEEIYDVYYKVYQIPEDPGQYQGGLEDLKDDLLDYVNDMVNSMEIYNEELEDFVESYHEELTSCQKDQIIDITGWILIKIQKTINQMEEIVEIYQLEMPENWLEELEETLAQTNQILSELQ